MKNLAVKIRILFLPLIFISLSFLAIYTFLHWLVVIKYGRLNGINEELLDYWIPFVLSYIIVLLVMWGRIKKLKFSYSYWNSFPLYIFIAGLTVAIPAVIAVSYTRTATGKLTKIESSAKFDKTSMTKYYEIDSMYLDKNYYGAMWTYKNSGRYGQDRTFYEYIATPLMSSPSDTTAGEFDIWYGFAFEQQIDNDLEENIKDSLFANFRNRNMQSFRDTNLYAASYFERLGTSVDQKGLAEAVKYSGIAPKTDAVILVPRFDSFESRNGFKLGWVFISLWLMSTIWLLMLLAKPLKEPELVKKNHDYIKDL